MLVHKTIERQHTFLYPRDFANMTLEVRDLSDAVIVQDLYPEPNPSSDYLPTEAF
jgi:hypothetical protein